MNRLARTANNDLVTVSARLTMLALPFIVGALGWLVTHYLDERFAEVKNIAGLATVRAEQTAANTAVLTSRVSVIEANITSGAADRAQFQKQISQQVDKLTDVATATSNQVSAISATLNVMREEGSKVAATTPAYLPP